MKMTSRISLSLNKFRTAAALLLVAGTTASNVFGWTTPEYWISTTPLSGGSHVGTMDDPFDGSTQSAFDSAMNSSTLAGATLHLMGGTYTTKGSASGGWTAKNGIHLLGAGIGVTTIKFASGSPAGTYAIENGSSSDSNITVADLTIDGTGTTNVDGIYLLGSELNVRRVEVKNLTYTTGSSLFAIHFYNSASAASIGNNINDCLVSGITGACNAIFCVGNSSGYMTVNILNNSITYSGNYSNALEGINIYYTDKSIISGNRVTGGQIPVFINSGPNSNLIISYNHLDNCQYGILFINSGANQQNVMMAYNNIGLAYVTGYGALGYNGSGGLYLANGSSYSNICFIGNTLRFDTSAGTTPYAVVTYNTTGLTIANNTIDSGFGFVIDSSSSNVNQYNNVDLTGAFITAANQIDLPNGLTRRTVTASDTLSYTNHYVGVQGNSLTLTLPSAASFGGKELVVVMESGTGTTTISAPSGQTINGLSSVSLAVHTGTNIVSDGSNWYAH